MLRETSIISIFAEADIAKISEIEVGEQSFCAEIHYKLKWRATKDEYNQWQNKLMFPAFKPNISLSNTKAIDILYTIRCNKYFEEENIRFGCNVDNEYNEYWVVHNFTVKATFYKQYKLNNFPFDCHDLSIKLNVGITPLTWDENESHQQFKIYPAEKQCVCLSKAMYLNTQWILYPEPTIEFKTSYKAITEKTLMLILNGYIRYNINNNNYRINDIVTICDNYLGNIDNIICIKKIHSNKKIKNKHFTSMDIHIKISRNYQFYIYYFLLIYLIITSLSMISLFLYTDTLCEQIISYLLLILSIIIIHFNISILLQTMSCLTFLDKYCFGCIAFISFINIIESKYFHLNKNLDIIQLIIMFILFNCYFIIYGLICYEKERKIIKMKGSDSDRNKNNNRYSYY